jgi:hypothetical protein
MMDIGGGNISKICLDIDEGLLEELRMQAVEIESDCRDLIVEYIEKGLNGCDNMQSICISDEIMNGITDRSKEINCNPEKLVNSILYDYLTDEDYEEAFELFNHYNRSINFSDCTILVSMQKHGIGKIASFDADFDKIRGFERIH